MKAIDLDHAVAAAAHRIAAGVHGMLAETGMTVSELKDKLTKFPAPQCRPETVDAILTATNSHTVTMNDLSNVAWALGFEWDFHIVRWPQDAAPTPDENQEPER